MKHPMLYCCALFVATMLLRAMLVHPLAAGLAAARQVLLGL